MNSPFLLNPVELLASVRLIIPEIMLAFGAIMVLTIEALAGPAVRRRIGGLVALLTTILALLANIALHVQLAPDDLHFSAFDGLLAIDATTGILRTVILATLLLGYCFTWQRQIWTAVRAEVFSLTMLAAVGAIVMVQATHLLVLVMGLELLSLPLYTLATLRKGDPRGREAGLKYFILGSFASAILIFGLALLYGAAGSVHYDQLYQAHIDGRLYGAGAILVLVGLLFKGGLLPFYVWSPDVYEGAPDSLTGLMAALAKVGAFGALLRIAGPFFGGLPEVFPALLVLIAALTMFFGNLLALAQSNLKRLLAYSSVAHAGYLLLGILALGSPKTLALAQSGLLFYLATYLFTIVAAFALLAHLQGPEGQWEINDVEGAAVRHPGWSFTLTVILFSLAGIPPLAGFFGKAYLFHAALGAGYGGLAVFGILTSVMSVFYYLRVIVALYFRDPHGKLELDEPRTARWARTFVVVWLVLLGLLPGLLYQPAWKASLWGGRPALFPGPALPSAQVREAKDAVFAPIVRPAPIRVPSEE